MIVNTPNIFKINRLVKIIKISNIVSFLLKCPACCSGKRAYEQNFGSQGPPAGSYLLLP